MPSLRAELADVAVERIVLPGPALDLAGRHVRLVVVLRVTLSPVGHQLDQRDASSRARPVHRLLGDLVRRQHVVAVGPDAGNAVADRLVHQAARAAVCLLVGVE